MARRKRKRDRFKINAKQGQKFGPNDSFRERHKKRKQEANRLHLSAGLAFLHLGAWLKVSNDGHHWSIVKPGGLNWQWWPSTAKLVIDEDWNSGIHIHTWQDIFRLLRDFMESE